ncbi:MAG TPA: MoxR family ATPase [Abditibacteriaceae bacterium]|nr:MoxR family ATPase [Abditibacteriaceae bacterium]
MNEPTIDPHETEIVAGATQPVKSLVDAARTEVARAVVGQDEIITQFLIALLVRGHVLLEGVPGIAKTLAAKALAHVLNADFKRIQFTPDLMPSDVTGTHVFDTRSGEFSLRQGPVFTDILLADEINRTPPKTQAALLEAMQERHVTIDGNPHQLSTLFTVFATQNPIDYEGTYPLPEAQLDRFLMKVQMSYPTPEEEVALLERIHHGFDAHALAASGLRAVVTKPQLEAARAAVRAVTVSSGILQYITQIVTRTRGFPALTLGGSPRASIALLECAKALAAINGRDYVIPEDLKTVAPPVLRHRLLLRAESEMEGLKTDDVVRSVLGAVEVPR